MVRIPTEYQEVEYLESTGSQWIKTNIDARFSATFEAEVVFTTRNDYESYGAGFYDAKFRLAGIGWANASLRIGYGTTWRGYNDFSVLENLNKIYKYKTELKKGDQNIYLNDVLVAHYIVNISETSLPNIKIGIFGRCTGDAADLLCKVKMYSLIISDGGEILGNFIPCYRKSDNEPGMYDTVSETFFTNSGTGTFLVGGDVNYSNTNLLEVRRRILLNTPHVESMSGNPAIFTTDMAANLKECKIRFSPVQAGEGTPSPENVRPISGWDGVSLKIQKGKNYLPSIDMVVWRIGYFNNSGKAINSDGYYRTNPILVPAGDYTLSTKYGRWKGIFAKDQNDVTVAFTERNANAITVTLPTSAYIQVYVDSSSEEVQLENNSIATDYEPSKNTSFLIKDINLNTKNILPPFNLAFWRSGHFNSSGEKRNGSAYVNSIPIKVSAGSYSLSSENTAWKGVYAEDLEGNKTAFKELLGKTLTVDVPVDGYIRVYLESIQNAQLEYGFTATSYEPYVEPQTVDVTFPQTIFGGYVDLIKGEIVEEWINVDMGSLNWVFMWNTFVCQPSGIKKHEGIGTLVKAISEIYPTGTVTAAGNIYIIEKVIRGRNEYQHTTIKDSTYSTAEDFKTAITGYKMAYLLATPNVYSLTPQTIKALKGLNNIYSDANGNIEVKFWSRIHN